MAKGSIRDIFRGKVLVLPEVEDGEEPRFFEFQLADETAVQWERYDLIGFVPRESDGRLIATNVTLLNEQARSTGVVVQANSRLGLIRPSSGYGMLTFGKRDVLPPGSAMASKGDDVSYRLLPGTDAATDVRVID